MSGRLNLVGRVTAAHCVPTRANATWVLADAETTLRPCRIAVNARRELEPDWRPEMYWPPLPHGDDLIGRVRGARRRALLRDALATGDFANIDPGVIREALNVEERRALLQAHPQLALGEYLPELEDADLPEGEVEIARLYLASGAGNTISIRARRTGTQIHLRAVDGFGDRLSITPDRIERPFSDAELLAAVKTLECHGPLAHGEVYWTRELEGEIDLESAAEFISGESEIYPGFADYVERDNQDWFAEQQEDSDDDEE